MSAAAGTVVTEMKTPTRAPLFADVRDSTPAIPASTATTTDQRSGAVMNPVSGRSAVSSSVPNQPRPPADERQQGGQADRHGEPDDQRRPRPVRAIRRPPVDERRRPAPASGANSGPSTIAPMTRIAESLMIAIAASSVAIVRKAR